ncbi:MAG TPA: SGNH/GDSL hydrolase family protein [Terriglobia bacterium]|nr:SGNH/GDSL hydrolase family protein [Terriglobia bacterium]
MAQFHLKKTLWVFIFSLLIVLSGIQASAAQAEDSYYLKSGDRVVFYGDSITQQQYYTMDVEDYTLTRFPALKVSFVNSGWGGDRVTGGAGGPIDLRLNRDVFPYKPTVVTIMLGMNDGEYRPFEESVFHTYSAGYEHIIQSLRDRLPGVRITVIEPSPYDDVTRPPNFAGGYNGVLIRYGEFVADLAHRLDLTLANMNAPFVANLERANRLDPTLAQKIVPDRIHPSPGGHLWMSEALLKSWNAPGLVTAVEIDAAQSRVSRAENTRVTDLKTGRSLTWTQMDDALPMPINLKDPLVLLALRSSDFIQALDQETLQVGGLSGSKYALKIDGENVGDFTAGQLARGINLAALETPMLQQVELVHKLTQEHNHVHFDRWRDVQVPLAGEDFPAIQQAERALDKLEQKLIAQQRAAAQPKPHRYELLPE